MRDAVAPLDIQSRSFGRSIKHASQLVVIGSRAENARIFARRQGIPINCQSCHASASSSSNSADFGRTRAIAARIGKLVVFEQTPSAPPCSAIAALKGSRQSQNSVATISRMRRWLKPWAGPGMRRCLLSRERKLQRQRFALPANRESFDPTALELAHQRESQSLARRYSK